MNFDNFVQKCTINILKLYSSLNYLMLKLTKSFQMEKFFSNCKNFIHNITIDPYDSKCVFQAPLVYSQIYQNYITSQKTKAIV